MGYQCVCMFVVVRVEEYVYVRVRVFVCMFVVVCVEEYVCVCVWVCMCVYMSVYVYVFALPSTP